MKLVISFSNAPKVLSLKQVQGILKQIGIDKGKFHYCWENSGTGYLYQYLHDCANATFDLDRMHECKDCGKCKEVSLTK